MEAIPKEIGTAAQTALCLAALVLEPSTGTGELAGHRTEELLKTDAKATGRVIFRPCGEMSSNCYSIFCLRAILAPLLVAEPIISAIHTSQRLLEVPLKLLLNDVRGCCTDELFGDSAGSVWLRSWFA